MSQFGGKVTQELKSIYSKSPNWKNGKFENLVETTMSVPFRKVPKLLFRAIFKAKGVMPKQDLPVLKFNNEQFLSPSEKTKMIWFGHSVVLFRMNGKTLLIDPMLGPNASPIAPFKTKRFSKNTIDIIDDLPEIDVMLITHDHYDHIDLASIKKLKLKTKQYFVALGVKRHLVSWGIDPELITEFDWWDNVNFSDISITFTPTQHFSGRGIRDRFMTLWGGWAFKTKSENIYFSGDGGYGNHFKEVGEKLGPFDFAFMECGQYNENWKQIHLHPNESVQAALDAKVNKATPVHWAGFCLSDHHWKEPMELFSNAANSKNLTLFDPQIGELFSLETELTSHWWEVVE